MCYAVSTCVMTVAEIICKHHAPKKTTSFSHICIQTPFLLENDSLQEKYHHTLTYFAVLFHYHACIMYYHYHAF